MRAVYPLLRKLAQAQLSRVGGDPTLQATELVHEAYERLQMQSRVEWKDRSHFMAICATVLRRVLIDELRHRDRAKRGGGLEHVTLSPALVESIAGEAGGVDWLELDAALSALTEVDARAARIAELRLFGGLEVEEVAEVTGTSTATVGRQWRFARAWLTSRLAP